MSMNGQGNLCRSLKLPELDEGYIPILIVLAASPDKFYFKPILQGINLENMMLKMQAYYGAADLPELKQEDVVKGVVCAGKFKGMWYRFVVANGTMIESCVPVRFCDFGDVDIIPVSSLRELHSEFQELPFVAMRGKLAGVVPTDTNWSVEDCLRFKGLVENKIIVAKTVNIQECAEPLDTVAELDLVDTTTEDDIVISEVFIEERRAVKN